MPLDSKDTDKIVNALKSIAIYTYNNDAQAKFESALLSKLRTYDVDINSTSDLNLKYPNDIDDAAILITSKGTLGDREIAVKKFVTQSNCPHKPYRQQLRDSLKKANIYNAPIAPSDPEPLFEEKLVKKLQEYDVDITSRSQLKIKYPQDILSASQLIETNGTIAERETASKMFADNSNISHRPYRKLLRSSLKKASIYNAPESPGDPEPLFEEKLVKKLQEYDVDITSRSQLKIRYPQDITSASQLIETSGTLAERETAAKLFADNSNISHRPYRKLLRTSLKKASIYNAPESPGDPEPLFEEKLIKKLQEYDVDITSRSQLKIKYPQDIPSASLLIETNGTIAERDAAAKMFADNSNISHRPYRKLLRASLKKANIYSAPEAPGDPEPLFEEKLVERLKEFDVDITDRSQLKINYPQDVEKASQLVEKAGNISARDAIARTLAIQSGRSIKPKNQPITSTTSTHSVSKPIIPITPRSSLPSPLKLDRTITANKLLQTNSGGKSNIETLGEQGQLGDAFTSEIWIGRREEMDEAWQNVPEIFRNQVNIEVIRSKLSQSSIRDKFNIDNDTSWEQGF